MENQLVAGRYSVGKYLGRGAFGQTHLATDVYTNEKVAIKFEKIWAPYRLLRIEAEVYSVLGRELGLFPTVRWYGRAGQHNALVMDLLGTNLENLLKECGGRFSLKTVLMLAVQMLKLIEHVHSKSYLHRDLKPDNFVMGHGRKFRQVFLIDFGLAKLYRDPATHEHIPYNDGRRMIGTAVFASINSHDGIELSRRDDLESLGYVLVYFLKGSLPWMNIKAESHFAFFREIRNKKVSTSIEDLCQGLPSAFKSYFRHVSGLRFDQAPNYRLLKNNFNDLFVRKGHRYDYGFDWIKNPVPDKSKYCNGHHKKGFGKMKSFVKGFFRDL